MLEKLLFFFFSLSLFTGFMILRAIFEKGSPKDSNYARKKKSLLRNLFTFCSFSATWRAG